MKKTFRQFLRKIKWISEAKYQISEGRPYLMVMDNNDQYWFDEEGYNQHKKILENNTYWENCIQLGTEIAIIHIVSITDMRIYGARK